MLPLNIGTSEWLEELAPSTSNVVAQVWWVQLLAKQALWVVPRGRPCQGSDLGCADGVLPGFDPSFTSLHKPCLALLQECFESFDVGRHGRAYRVDAFLRLVSVRRATLLPRGAEGGGRGVRFGGYTRMTPK